MENYNGTDNMTMSYVVLHYKTLDVTVECLDNLIAVSSERSPIVVVDNGSNDGSAEMLQQRYANRIVLLRNNENLGFARGNNTGFRFVKEKLSSDFVTVMNSDVVISSHDYENKITRYMEENDLQLCGPDILTPDGRHQNPLLRKPFSSWRIAKQMAIDIVRLAMLKLHIFDRSILAAYSKSGASYHKKEPDLNNITDCILHGSCVVYARSYVEKEDFAFLPVTFLYGEEMILYDYCCRKGYKIGICPNTQVLHLGGKATKIDATPRNKQIYKTSQMLKSMYQLLKLRIKR